MIESIQEYLESNLANTLTVARLLLLPVILGLFALESIWGGFAIFLCLIVYIIAAITDYFDGYIARKLNQISDFGTFLDPISDKIFVASLLLLLAAFGKIGGIWLLLVMLIFAREFLISGLREFLGSKDVKVPVTNLAKYKTAAQMLSLGFLIIGGYAPFAKELGLLFLTAATVLTLMTGASYMKAGWQHMKSDEE